MAKYIITLGTLTFTRGHCHRCAQLALDVTVEADSRQEAVEIAISSMRGSMHQLSTRGSKAIKDATLTVQYDEALLGSRSVRVEELD